MEQIQSKNSTTYHFRWYKLNVIYLINNSKYNPSSETDFIYPSVIYTRVTPEIKIYKFEKEDLSDFIILDNLNEKDIPMYREILKFLQLQTIKQGNQVSIERIVILTMEPLRAISKVDEEVVLLL